jgi:hypothetical protein
MPWIAMLPDSYGGGEKGGRVKTNNTEKKKGKGNYKQPRG